jgi:hypothetical protein
MKKLEVTTEPIGQKLFRLCLYLDGQYIGEYERSQESDIDRKRKEIELASDLLCWVGEHHGSFVVRWDSNKRRKSIRVGRTEVCIIPRQLWQDPSWKNA